MHKSYFFILVLFSFFACQSTSERAKKDDYQICVEPNYYASLAWWGMEQLGYLGGEANPAYASWSSQLAKAGEDIQFKAPVAGGPLFTFIYQIPGYMDPADPDELDLVHNGLLEFVRSGSFDRLKADWPEETKYWDVWYNPVYIRILLKDLEQKEADVIKTLTLWNQFIHQVWDEYQPVYEGKMADYPFDSINRLYQDKPILEKWDHVMGEPYPYDEFVVCICPENNTLASSLGPEKIVFGARYTEGYLDHTMVHESGVRYFPFDEFANNERYAEIMFHDYDNLLRMIETEVCFRKPQMIDYERDAFLTGMQLEEIVELRKSQTQGDDNLIDFMVTMYSKAREAGVIK